MIAAPAYKDKSIAILGLGRTGMATARALAASGAHVTLWDDVAANRLVAEKAGFNLSDLRGVDWTDYDALVPSPGIPATFPKPHDAIARAKEAAVPIFGDLEIFGQSRSSLEPHSLAVITGTNGKSTTTALLSHILAHSGRPTAMGGNIGTAILDLEPLPRDGVYVVEASSFQLEQSISLAADIAILLNIVPDHLDRHGNFENYVAAKRHLFDMQRPEQVAIIAVDDEPSRIIADQVCSKLIRVSAHRAVPHGVYVRHGVLFDNLSNEDHAIALQADWPALQGPHNAQNVAAVTAAARILGLSREAIVDALRSYQALPHRMEPLERVEGVPFINDSKATNPDAAAQAIAAFDHVHWIMGGIAKNDELGPLEAVLSHVSKAYLIGASQNLYRRLLEGRAAFECYDGLERAAAQAFQDAQETGGVVLLSPACASQDQYKDFAARGEHFRRIVHQLKGGVQ